MTRSTCPANPGVVKIATYNLNGIRARLPRLLEWLEERASTRAQRVPPPER